MSCQGRSTPLWHMLDCSIITSRQKASQRNHNLTQQPELQAARCSGQHHASWLNQNPLPTDPSCRTLLPNINSLRASLLTLIAGSSLTNQRTASSSRSLFQLTRLRGLRGFLSAAASAAVPEAAPATAAFTAPAGRGPKLEPKPVRLRPGRRPAGGCTTRSETVTVCSGVTCRSTATRGCGPAAAAAPVSGGDGRRPRGAPRGLPAAAAPGCRTAAAPPAISLPASAVSTSCTPWLCKYTRATARHGTGSVRGTPFIRW